MDLTVTMIDQSLRPRGQLSPLSVTANLISNDVGKWQLTCQRTAQTRRFQRGWGVVIQDDLGLQVSGPATSIKTQRGENGVQEFLLEGVTHEHVLADRLTMPNPKKAPDAQDVAYYKAKGTGETIIRNLVDQNAGPAALPNRRTLGLSVPISEGRGSTVTVNTRLKVLLDELKTLAGQAGLVYRVRYENAAMVFEISEPRDQSRRVRLRETTGAVRSSSTTLKAPTGNVVIVGGQGEGADRTLVADYGAQPDAWGSRLIEVFKDRRDTNDSSTLGDAATEAITSGAESAAVDVDVTDAATWHLGRDFQLGDLVTAHVDGGQVVEPVQAATVTWAKNYRAVALTLGDHGTEQQQTPAWVKQVRKLQQDIRALEAR